MTLLLLLLAQSPFIDELDNHFEKWDVDGNGQLSKKEIDALLDDPSVTGKAAAAVAALKLAERGKQFEIDDVSKKMLDDYAEARKAGAKIDGPNYDQMFAAAQRRIKRAGKEIFAEGQPRLADVNQGPLGDCFFLAPLGAFLHRDAERLRTMVSDEDGTLVVAFGNGKTVKLPLPTDARLGISSSAANGGCWVALFEEAYARLRNESLPENKQKDEATDLIAHGGSMAPSLKALTGKDTTRIAIRDKNKKDAPPEGDDLAEKTTKVRDAITSAVKDNRLAVTGTPKESGVPGIAGSHAYAILGFDPDKDAVKLWNPHGNAFKPRGPEGLKNGYDTRDGLFTLPLADFMKIFGGVTCEKP